MLVYFTNRLKCDANTWLTTVVYFARQFCLPLRSDGMLTWDCFDCASSSCRLHKLLLNYCLGCFWKADLTSEYLFARALHFKRLLINNNYLIVYCHATVRGGLSYMCVSANLVLLPQCVCAVCVMPQCQPHNWQSYNVTRGPEVMLDRCVCHPIPQSCTSTQKSTLHSEPGAQYVLVKR